LDSSFDAKQSILFSLRAAQLSKALWKSVEKDWQEWVKPYNLNINEFQILWVAHQLEGASVSGIAKFGVMHVSTAFNFSKKLEDRNLLKFSKKTNDKRNTYIELTEDGESLLLSILESYEKETFQVSEGALPIKELYGKFPEFSELMTIVRYIYGEEFMHLFEESLQSFENDFMDKDGTLLPADRSAK
jgi:MarR family protease production transcriptional regulator HPr